MGLTPILVALCRNAGLATNGFVQAQELCNSWGPHNFFCAHFWAHKPWNRILINQPLLAMARLAQALSDILSRHPRRVLGGVGVLLLGTGVTAFGVSPMMPDAAKLPVTQVFEPLSLNALPDLQLGPHAVLTLYRSDTVRRNDTTQSLLLRLGVHDTQSQDALRNHDGMRQLFDGRSAGKLVSVETDERGGLIRLSARWLPDDERQFTRLVVARNGDGFETQIQNSDLTVSSRVASGVIESSLFAATDSVNLPDSVAVQLAEMFASDIDFRRDLRKGDRFNVVYESLEADGEPLRAGRVLSAEFINNGKTHEAVWFQEAGQKGAFFGFDGQSMRKAFLGSPLEFSRVSSGYGMRFHPILGREKAHLGVDYAAPTGTPVRTIADGVVTFAGTQRGYGNVIEVTHRDNKSTLFAHLSRIDVKRGERVEQGEFIGAVGTTGRSTGPHLHFEFRDHGVHQDPLEVARESENIPINPNLRARFNVVAEAQRAQLDAARSIQQASAD
jgi:murein DD-endopeptidase MepM/ murein hydrolase activator NlpD